MTYIFQQVAFVRRIGFVFSIGSDQVIS